MQAGSQAPFNVGRHSFKPQTGESVNAGRRHPPEDEAAQRLASCAAERAVPPTAIAAARIMVEPVRLPGIAVAVPSSVVLVATISWTLPGARYCSGVAPGVLPTEPRVWLGSRGLILGSSARS